MSADRGFSRQVFSRAEMWTANSSFDTDCGSRHGTCRTRTGAEPSGSTRASGRRTSSAVDINLGPHRLRFNFELGVAQRAHFRQVQAIQLRLSAHALADEEDDDPVDD